VLVDRACKSERGQIVFPRGGSSTHNRHFLLRGLVSVGLLVYRILLKEGRQDQPHFVRVLTALQRTSARVELRRGLLTGNIMADIPWKRVSMFQSALYVTYSDHSGILEQNISSSPMHDVADLQIP
jgi:hypothetical protein